MPYAIWDLTLIHLVSKDCIFADSEQKRCTYHVVSPHRGLQAAADGRNAPVARWKIPAAKRLSWIATLFLRMFLAIPGETLSQAMVGQMAGDGLKTLKNIIKLNYFARVFQHRSVMAILCFPSFKTVFHSCTWLEVRYFGSLSFGHLGRLRCNQFRDVSTWADFLRPWPMRYLGKQNKHILAPCEHSSIFIR